MSQKWFSSGSSCTPGTLKYFQFEVDDSKRPWPPRLKYKPNALHSVCLPECVNGVLSYDGDHPYKFEKNGHPYEFELNCWKPSQERLQMQKPIRPKELEETPFLFVKNKQDLKKLLEELKGESEISVDVEHYSYPRSVGYTCLIQISTNKKDYIIDTLELESELQVLNKIFTDPKVLKVFHGADNDVIWLQRDLSLYLVNMFDTQKAAKVLNLSKTNFAYVLYYYCRIIANKQYQLYDWRTRPLPEDAIEYAREDTHYLLYIYKIMNNELLEKAQGNTNLLRSVYQMSVELCKKRYMKLMNEGKDYQVLLDEISTKIVNLGQTKAFGELHRWRDRKARESRENPEYILPMNMLIEISETLPKELHEFVACCGNTMPHAVRMSLREIQGIITTARTLETYF